MKLHASLPEINREKQKLRMLDLKLQGMMKILKMISLHTSRITVYPDNYFMES